MGKLDFKGAECSSGEVLVSFEALNLVLVPIRACDDVNLTRS